MMRILIVSDEEWNDFVYGNGVLTNWFSGFDAEFAQIYCSPGLPINNICSRYFQITDKEMASSMICKGKAGRVVHQESGIEWINAAKQNAQRKGFYGFIKKISLWMHSPVLMIRDFIWCFGRYDEDTLKAFIGQFSPDIVFCPRLITPKLMRLERIVSKYTKAPFVAFTGDNEASLEGYSWSPLYWLRKFYIHRMFEKHISLYKFYLMHSNDQAYEYNRKYGIATSTFFKCGNFTDKFEPREPGSPIHLVYAGRLYCNRWKSLAQIGIALKQLNVKGIRMVLDIYTTEKLSSVQKKALSKENFVYVKGRVTPEELVQIYQRADIALHVESMDKKNRLLTKVSFSTKIIDLMSSTCAIMAICWEQHAGLKYLKEKDAAFCISCYDEILPKLQQICDHPELIREYALKAYECGRKYHNKDIIKNQIKTIFEKLTI